MVNFTPRLLYLRGKSSQYTWDRMLSEPQSRSGDGGEEKNSQPPPGIEIPNPDRPAQLTVSNMITVRKGLYMTYLT